MSGYPVVIQENYGTLTTNESLNVTTTPVQVDFAGGLTQVSIAYVDLGSAVGTLIYACFNASDDTDAATKLGSASSRELIMLGERRTWIFDSAAPCTRIDIKSNTASETGDSVVQFSGKAPS